MSWFTKEDYKSYIDDEKHTIATLKAMLADSHGMSQDYIDHLKDQLDEAEANIRYYEDQLSKLD